MLLLMLVLLLLPMMMMYDGVVEVVAGIANLVAIYILLMLLFPRVDRNYVRVRLCVFVMILDDDLMITDDDGTVIVKITITMNPQIFRKDECTT